VLRFVADVQGGLRAKLTVLLTGSSASGPSISASIKRGGRPLEVEAPHLFLPDSEGRNRGNRAAAQGWNLFRATLPTGRSEVECVFQMRTAGGPEADVPPAVGPWSAQARAFVDAEYNLRETHRIEIRHARIAAKPRPTLPMHWNAQRRTRTIVLAGRTIKGPPPKGPPNIAFAHGPCPPSLEVDSLYRTYTVDPVNDAVLPARGKRGMAWASAETPMRHFLVLTWSERHRVNKVYVRWGQTDWLPRAYRVECRVNGEFEPVPRERTAWQAAKHRDTVLQFPAVLTDAVRIVQKAGGGSATRPNLMGIAEVAVYE